MTAKDRTTPWLPSSGAKPRPLADCLPRTGPAAASGAWLEPVGATGGRCPRCSELEQRQASVEADRAAARSAGHAEGQAALGRVRDRMAVALAALEDARATREAEVTQLIVDVALAVCAELAPTTAAIDARGLGELVRTALGLAGTREVTLRVRADDAAILGGQLPTGIACHIDDELAPGEVWVDAPRLVVDARWATRLAALREPLLALVRIDEPMLEAVTTPPEVPDAG